MVFQTIPSVSDLRPGAINGLWTIGDTAAGHAEIGTHPADGSPSAGKSGIRLYAADGVSVLIDFDATDGAGTLVTLHAPGMTAQSNSAPGPDSVSATTYAVGPPLCFLDEVSPSASGVVVLTLTSRIKVNVAGNFCFVGYTITDSLTGTHVLVPASDVRAVGASGTGITTVSRTTTITGVPAGVYGVTAYGRVQAGTVGTVEHTEIVWVPSL